MNEKQYIRAILWRLRVPRRTKKRIAQDLTQDICTAREQGESMQQIVSRMGSAKKAAREQNESCGVRFDAHTRLWRIVVWTLLLACAVLCVAEGVAALRMHMLLANGSVGVIGGADGPTAVFVTARFRLLPRELRLCLYAAGIAAFAFVLRRLGRRRKKA